MLNQGLTLVYVGLTNSRGKIAIPNVLTGSCEEQTVKSAYQDVAKVFVVSVLERPAEKGLEEEPLWDQEKFIFVRQ